MNTQVLCIATVCGYCISGYQFHFFEAVTIQVMVLSVLTLCMFVLELAGLVYAKDKSGFLHKVCNCVLRRTEIRIS